MIEKPKGIFIDPITTSHLLEDFTNEEIGAVFRGIVEFANTATVPTFTDRAVHCLFCALNTWRRGRIIEE